MRYAIVSDGIVTNVIEADAEFAALVGALEAPEDCAIGWLHDGKVFTSPKVEPAPTVLPDLTPRQFLLAAYDIGITEDMITAQLEGDPIGLIEWKHATSIERSHPLVNALGVTLGLPPEHIDAMWLYAASS